MLIPDNITDFNSTGEKILFLKFKSDKSAQDLYVLHSVFTTYHFKNMSGELDFLVLAPGKGIFAIEVKHGRVSRQGGTWQYTNKLGAVTSKTVSPFAQVNATMNSIRSYILEKVRHRRNLFDRLSKLLWGSGVAFTGIDGNIDFGPEAFPWQVMTKESLSLPVSVFIDTLSKGFHTESQDKNWYDINRARPSNDDCILLLNVLRGDFEVSYTGINKILDNDLLIEQFTKEQFGLLSFVEYNPRCLIQGNAGTGKTIMALEILRRNVSTGKKIALFCFNRLLGDSVSKSASLLTDNLAGKSYAGALHSFLMQQTGLQPVGDPDQMKIFFTETLPFEFLIQNESIPEKEKFDLLILDEAQDLLTPYYLEVFDKLVKGGVKEGNWVFFGDFSNQAIYLGNPDETLKILSDYASYTKFPPLKINCRNTVLIATQNTLVTGVEKPEFKSGAIGGEPIIIKFPAVNAQINIITDIVGDLISMNIPLDKITLLSPIKFENTVLASSPAIRGFISSGLQCFTIQSFKGLENAVIIIHGFVELNSENAQRLMYIGISRARQKLFLVLDKKLEIEYNQLIRNNFTKIQ